MAIEAVQVEKNGQQVWKVELSAKVIGKRQRIFRDTKEKVLAAANEVLAEKGAFGIEASKITLQERALILRWRGRLAVDDMERILNAGFAGRSGTMSLPEAVTKYRAGKEHLSPEHQADLKFRLASFTASFQQSEVGGVRPGELDSFIKKQGPSAANYYKVLRAFFSHAALHDWRADNPMLKIKVPEVEIREKEVFTIKTMSSMIRYAAKPPAAGIKDPYALLWMLILGGLCGLRYTECLRLQWEDIDLVTGEIFVRKMKTRKRGIRERWVAILPVARAWFDKIGHGRTGRLVGLTEKNLRIRRDQMLEATKTRWIDNGCRRSFGSHHLAAFENADLTAAQMGHTSAETTVGKYRVVRRKEVGLAWFNELTPEKVLSGE